MAKITLNDVTNITGNEVSAAATLNANFTAIETAIENTLSRDGTTPNQMQSTLDMNSNTIINLPDAVNINEAVTLRQVQSLIAASSSGLISLSRESATATASQTLFTLASLTYTQGVNSLFVFRNGAKLRNGVDYTETSTTSITLTSGANAGDSFEFLVNATPTSLSGSATDIGYVPSGTGAVATNVQAQLRGENTTAPKILGYQTDVDNGANIHRLADRVFIGGASALAGTSKKTDGATVLGDPARDINSFYLEASASLVTVSAWGGVGGSFGVSNKDRYTYGGYGVWVSGETVVAGEKRGYRGRLYSAQTSGTTGGTAPSHTSGTVSDGGVDWTFDKFSPGTPIGLACAAVSEVTDGTGTWASYTEAVRSAGTGGTIYGREVAVKNKGSNVTNNPYSVFPAGSTIGDYFAGGGDATLGAPANPSTCGILLGKNATTFNKGIVVASDAITGTDGVSGSGSAIALARGHKIEWYYSGGIVGASIHSNVDASNSSVSLLFDDNTCQFKGATGEINVEFQSAASSVNYIRFQPASTGSAPNLRAVGADANVDLRLRTQGSGVIRFGTHTALGSEAVTGYITIKDDAGTLRKIAVVS